MSPVQQSEKFLSDKEFQDSEPMMAQASAHSDAYALLWSKIASTWVGSHVKSLWRYRLADGVRRAHEGGYNAPSVTYLMQLHEARELYGDFDKYDCPVSVLINGRVLGPKLTELLADKNEPHPMTVARINAWVAKYKNEDDPRTVDQIEAEQGIAARDQRERSGKQNRRNKELEELRNWNPEDADGLLDDLRDRMGAYDDAIARLEAEGAEFTASEVTVALRTVRNLASTLKEHTVPKSTKAA